MDCKFVYFFREFRVRMLYRRHFFLFELLTRVNLDDLNENDLYKLINITSLQLYKYKLRVKNLKKKFALGMHKLRMKYTKFNLRTYAHSYSLK